MSGRHVRIDINSQHPPDKSERSSADFAASAVALGRCPLGMQQQEHVHNAVLPVSRAMRRRRVSGASEARSQATRSSLVLGIGRADCPHSSRLSTQHLLTCVLPLRMAHHVAVRRY